MKTSVLISLLLAASAACAAGGATNESVILLHGLARTSASMRKMQAALGEAGYTVFLVDYPSTSKTVEQLSREHLAPAVAECQAGNPVKIHFVAHSLGNIVLRHYLSEQAVTNIGRIVMLGPPNKGSEVVDKIGHLTLFEWINGPAGRQLGTSSNSLPCELPVPAADIGVIAGTKSINLIQSVWIPGVDDGKVSLESARIDGMADFAEVATAHPFLMRNRQVIRMTIEFLQTGCFGKIPASE